MIDLYGRLIEHSGPSRGVIATLMGLLWAGPVDYIPYEGHITANQINRKLGGFDRKLKETHSICFSYFERH